jgi:hypothetical protein
MVLDRKTRDALAKQAQEQGITTGSGINTLISNSPLGYGGVGDPSQAPVGEDYSGQTLTAGSLRDTSTDAGGSTQDDLASYLEEQSRKAVAANVAALNSARDSALSALDRQESKIEPRYYDSRNTTQAQSDQQKRAFNEMSAARGLNSGANAQSAISSGVALQGAIGGLNRQEQAEYDDIAAQRASLDAQYDSQIAQAKMQGQSDLAAALYQEKVRRIDALTNKEQFDKQYALSEAGITGQYNGKDTLASRELANAQTQQAYDNAYNRWAAVGYVASQTDANILGVPVGTKTSDYVFQQASLKASAGRGGGSDTKDTLTFKDAMNYAAQGYFSTPVVNALLKGGMTMQDLYDMGYAPSAGGAPGPGSVSGTPGNVVGNSPWESKTYDYDSGDGKSVKELSGTINSYVKKGDKESALRTIQGYLKLGWITQGQADQFISLYKLDV